MKAFSFLHCADIHLGSPMRGLGRMPRALRDRLRDAPTMAFGRMVTRAIDQDVDAVIIAGDLFDGTDRNLRAQVQLRDQLRRLDEAGIPTLIASGNHDPLGSLSATVSLPPSVHVFGSTPEPVVIRRGDTELAHVYGISYTKSATYRNLAADFPRRPGGPFNIAVLHTNVGDRSGFARYAPCRLAELLESGYDYWALGHVHTRETLHTRRPIVHYPGNPQGLHTGEPGARGATLVKVSDAGTIDLHPVWTDVVRWHRARSSIDGLEAIDELVGAFAELAGNLRGTAADRMHIVRWTLTGNGPLHAALNRPGAGPELCDTLRAAEGIRAEGGVVWLERIELATGPARDMERLRNQQDYLGDILRLARQLELHPPLPPSADVADARPPGQEPAVSRSVREALDELLELPRLTRALGRDPWSLLSWKELVARAEAMAVEHLAPGEVSDR